jgi:undecaprenyl-diphosphatase
VLDSELVRSFIMGVVQGLTEFLPVSSTAHLILFPWLFGWGGELDTLSFDVALHAGTLLALLACFYRDWLAMLLSDRRLLWFIVAASFPAGIAGILLKSVVEHALRSPAIIAASLVVVGVLMLAAERITRPCKDLSPGSFSIRDALVIGFAQAIALVPGVSRSGITITAGLFRSLSRESAARFSFLLSTPVIAGATLLEGRKLLKHPGTYHADVFLIGLVSAFFSGLVAIKFLLAYLKDHRLDLFVYYRFFLAGVIVFLLFLR